MKEDKHESIIIQKIIERIFSELIILEQSRIIQLWKGIMILDALKLMDLSDSQYLIEIPDLSGAPKLKQLILRHYKEASQCRMAEMIRLLPEHRVWCLLQRPLTLSLSVCGVDADDDGVVGRPTLLYCLIHELGHLIRKPHIAVVFELVSPCFECVSCQG
ncbi:hypothetical protein CMV_020913 [Castanea mollissima]|uniref:Uncharacterized protein n=1 Tax=Castanea mollissima TaxID=60419 RepID=A0A8J4QX72_9ROSI|nr:hypothetical protein CMV_020913 [Castanea mollissima]